MFDSRKNIHYIIIIGCGLFGANIAGKLSEEENKVMVIDKDKSAFEKLPACYGGFLLNRDANDAGILLEADIQNATAIIAATGDDILNAFISKVAKDVYHVEHVFACLYDIKRKEIYQELGVKTICASDLWLDAFKKEVTL